MHERVETVDAKQETFNIDYSIDELIIAMDYWINTIHGRPIRGLGEVIAPQIVAAEEKFLGGEEIPTILDTESVAN